MNFFVWKHFAILFFLFVLAYKFKAYIDEMEDGFLKKALTVPAVIIFIGRYIYDIVVNHLLTVVFMDFPMGMDETVTNRMKRYKFEDGFKKKFAEWLCPILNKYDPDHC